MNNLISYRRTLLPALSLSVLTLTACRSSRHASKDDASTPTTTITQPSESAGSNDGGKAEDKEAKANKKDNKKDDKKDQEDSVSQLNIAAGSNLTAHVKIKVTQAGNNMSTSGTLRMRYGEVIQITLFDPILGIAEVGRMEIAPDNILVIDRINKRFVSTDYEEFKALKDNNVNFDAIQDIFWKEAQASDHLSYTIPASKPIKLDLQISGRDNSNKWNAHSSVSNKYTKTDVNKLFSSMMAQ